MEVETIARPRPRRNPRRESKPRAFASSACAQLLESRNAEAHEALPLLEGAARHLAIAIAGLRELVGPAPAALELVN